jgi:hypothetical protein
MSEPAPRIDNRSAAEIEKQVTTLLREYYLKGYDGPAWNETNDRLGATLIKIFARFVEIIIERLNQVPEKNFIAFLDLLGASRLPPQPARAQLTFALADGATGDTLVPAGTQVSGTAAGGGPPVIFETEHDLVVTSARLAAVFARDPVNDRYADWSAPLAHGASQGELVFQGKQAIEHAFYVGHETMLGRAAIEEVKLDFELDQVSAATNALPLQWEVWDGKEGIKLDATDNTANLTKSGQVVLRRPALIPKLIFPELIVGSSTSRWLRCRLLREGKPGLQLPAIKELKLTVKSSSTGLPVEAAYANTLPLDLGKELLPFGEKPRLGDCFYLAQHEAFSQAGAEVTLWLTVTDPKTYIPTYIPTIPRSGTPTLKWEFWNGKRWLDLTVPEDLKANIKAFTNEGDYQVTFTVPAEIRPTLLNGVENCWIRVRISSGDYGKDAGINVKTDKNGPMKDSDGQIIYTVQPSTLVPPQLSVLIVDYTLTSEAPRPEAIVTCNDFAWDHIEIRSTRELKPLKPLFQPMRDETPALYLGFTLPQGREVFPDQPLTLYFSVPETAYGTGPARSSSPDSPSLAWEYWKSKPGGQPNEGAWGSLVVEDGTQAMTTSGTVVWLPPADFGLRADFGLDKQYWLRILPAKGDYSPRLRRVLLNTTPAAQTYTFANEILGSSDGSKGQRFRASHAPVLPGQRLEVLEPDLPTALEFAAIRKDEGEDAIQIPAGATPRQEIWVRWHEVPDFYGSEGRDRHYVLDHLTGEVRFGDGLSGLIPPRGVGNLRLTRYRTGGGVHGNLPAGAIAQLATTLPYIDNVVNWEPASGGADAESLEALRERAPRLLRHGGRAVSRDDYEDLAIQASPEVVRAHCVPLWNRSSVEIFDAPATQAKGGHVTVVVLPRSDSPKPIPSIELVRRVQAYLDDRRLPGVTLHVVGPDYVCVTVTAAVVAVSLEAASRLDVKEVLARFLHPLTGGVDGRGWPWGGKPHLSSLYRCIEAIPGLDHVQTLTVEEEPKGLSETSYFLVYSGEHKVTITAMS